MIARIAGRISSLERQIGGTDARCRLCGGRGLPGIVIARSPDDPGTLRSGCPACGQASTTVKYILGPLPGRSPDTDPWDWV